MYKRQGNDYVGKGLSGGKVIVYQPKNSKLVAADNIIDVYKRQYLFN